MFGRGFARASGVFAQLTASRVLLSAAAAAGAAAAAVVVVVTERQRQQRGAVALARPRNILICGAPGSGKGTASARLVQDFGVVHVSSGDLLRAEVQAGTAAGLAAKKYMDAGELVPQEVFFAILKSRLTRDDCKQRGWLLDGYPRSKSQVALMNENGLVPDKVVVLSVSDDVAIARMCGRRTDPVTGEIYHMVFRPPPNDPKILARLEQRSDDTEDKAVTRLRVFHSNMDDIVNWYPAEKLIVVDGNETIEFVYEDIKHALLK